MNAKATLALALLTALAACGGGADKASQSLNSEQHTTLNNCGDVTVSVSDAQAVIDAAQEEAASGSDITVDTPEPIDSVPSGNGVDQTTPTAKGDGVTVVACGGTLVDNDNDTTTITNTTTDISGDTTTNGQPSATAKRLIDAIHAGEIFFVEVR